MALYRSSRRESKSLALSRLDIKDFYSFSYFNLNPCFVLLWYSDVLFSFILYIYFLKTSGQGKQRSTIQRTCHLQAQITPSKAKHPETGQFNFKWVQSNVFNDSRESHSSQIWNGRKSHETHWLEFSEWHSALTVIWARSEQLLVRYLNMLICWSAYYENLHNEVRRSVQSGWRMSELAVEQVQCAWLMV